MLTFVVLAAALSLVVVIGVTLPLMRRSAVAAAPSITSLTPTTGAVGSSVVIAGSNFGSTQGNGAVTFNGTTATVTSWGASSITATRLASPSPFSMETQYSMHACAVTKLL